MEPITSGCWLRKATPRACIHSTCSLIISSTVGKYISALTDGSHACASMAASAGLGSPRTHCAATTTSSGYVAAGRICASSESGYSAMGARSSSSCSSARSAGACGTIAITGGAGSGYVVYTCATESAVQPPASRAARMVAPSFAAVVIVCSLRYARFLVSSMFRTSFREARHAAALKASGEYGPPWRTRDLCAAPGSEFRATNSKFPFPGSEFQVRGSRLRAPGYRLRIPSSRFRSSPTTYDLRPTTFPCHSSLSIRH